MAEEQYETEVEFYTRYNHGASARMRPGLVDEMNEIIDKLYDERLKNCIIKMPIEKLQEDK